MAPFRDPHKLDSKIPVYTGPVRETPFVGTKVMLFRAEMKGKSAVSYLTYVQFNNVSFTDEKDATHKFPIDVEGKTKWWGPININDSTIRIYDSCPDFRFRFSKELYDVGALIGNWKRYTPVPGSTRGPVNPQERLGICKHTWSLLNLLKKQGKIVEK